MSSLCHLSIFFVSFLVGFLLPLQRRSRRWSYFELIVLCSQCSDSLLQLHEVGLWCRVRTMAQVNDTTLPAAFRQSWSNSQTCHCCEGFGNDLMHRANFNVFILKNGI